jgi:hypothetical protein
MEESIYWGARQTSCAVPKETPAPKTNETRIVEALEGIGDELARIRSLFERVVQGESESGTFGAAVRTTGR